MCIDAHWALISMTSLVNIIFWEESLLSCSSDVKRCTLQSCSWWARSWMHSSEMNQFSHVRGMWEHSQSICNLHHFSHECIFLISISCAKREKSERMHAVVITTLTLVMNGPFLILITFAMSKRSENMHAVIVIPITSLLDVFCSAKSVFTCPRHVRTCSLYWWPRSPHSWMHSIDENQFCRVGVMWEQSRFIWDLYHLNPEYTSVN